MSFEQPLVKKPKQGTRYFQQLRILIIEDNEDLAANIGDYLEDSGHIVDYAVNGVAGLHLALTQLFDVIILDIMLPGMDGITLCRRFREDAEKSNPILMLTAKDTIDDKLNGFNAGADDYLLKPFALKELEARLLALVRRSTQYKESKILEFGHIRMDMGHRQIDIDGNQIKLNRTCFRILEKLIRSAPQVVTREDLEHYLWGDWKPASDSLRTHIHALRKALDIPGKQSIIETIVGIGFRIRGE
ncbi:MAG: response regulator transcription factor [Desulfamplus sp.]|nr:response regulator transcription factor [Desulfamplus sp.]